ncbi:MAG: hypothetical protein GF398_12600 [Chitinivibrionales bacterium]|nr:hypothetical protein [Chitinivibrionales bacterium]
MVQRQILQLLLMIAMTASLVSGENTSSDEECTIRYDEHIFTDGDAIKITVFPDTTGFPNGIYSIDQRGCVYLPIIGLTPVAGMKVAEIESMLKDAWVDYMPHPNLQVRPLIRVSLLGGFYRPGLYYIDPRASLWDAVYLAGGTQREDGIAKLNWERSRLPVEADLVKLFQDGTSLEKAGFKSGDQIWVTPRPNRQGWEIFKSEVLPIFSFIVSTVSATITAIVAYESLQDNRNNP